MNTHCKRCGTAFKAPLADWQAVATCDECAGRLLSYFSTSTSPRQATNRIKATKRLYGRDAEQAEVEVLPCEVDFTPEPAPDYDEVAAAALHARFEADRAALGFGDHPAPTHIDPMYEAVEAGEREARARALARPGSLGFDG